MSNAPSPSLTERQQPSKKRYTAAFLKVREAEQRTLVARSLRRASDSHVNVGHVTAWLAGGQSCLFVIGSWLIC